MPDAVAAVARASRVQCRALLHALHPLLALPRCSHRPVCLRTAPRRVTWAMAGGIILFR